MRSKTLITLILIISCAVCILLMVRENSVMEEKKMTWTSVPATDPENAAFSMGVSAMYAGVVGQDLVMAGGANFPDVPAVDGGAKAFYDEIYILDGSQWKLTGRLPFKSAYGVTVSCGGRLILVGGASEAGAHGKVFTLSLEGGSPVIGELPDYPAPIEQAAGAVVGSMVYVAGGLVGGIGSDKMYCLDLEDIAAGWSECAILPEPMVQPAMAADGGRLYVWGGLNPIANSVSDKGYSYDPVSGKWENLPGIPDGGTMLGGCALTLSEGRIVCLAGVNRQVFTDAITKPFDRREYMSRPIEAYRFRTTVWVLDVEKNEWELVDDSRTTARAGAGLVKAGDKVYVIGGELKPGIRTPDVSFTTELR